MAKPQQVGCYLFTPMVNKMRWVALLLLFCASCGGGSSTYDYRIALDPEWTSLDLPGRETNIRAFSVELIEEIAKIKNVRVGIYGRNWENIMWGLQNEDYEGILSSMQPYLFYEKLYDFSGQYLLTGPTVVVPMKTQAKSLDDFNGKEIAVIQGSKSSLILEKYPGIIQRTYATAAQALLDISNGIIDGAVIDILTAEAYCLDLYKGMLKVAFPPLTPEGIRLVSLHGKSPKLIKLFDEGLKELKESGKYAELARKWNLAE